VSKITSVPVIAIDGPSASGKGTVAQRVAARLGFHYLDSGALYRLVTLGALQQRVALDDVRALARWGAASAVIGRALVEGRFTIEEAKAAAREAPPA